MENKAPVVHTDPTSSRWQKLLKYYGSCISAENTGESSLYSSKEGTEFLQVPAMEQEWVASSKENLEFEGPNEKIQAFINGPHWSRSPLSYFYGFPCRVKHIEQSRRQIIQPILIFGIDPVQTETGGYAFVLQSDRPRINFDFLTDKGLLTSIEQRKSIAEAVLGLWDDEKSRGQNLKVIVNTLAELLPQELLFPKDILSGMTIELKEGNTAEGGIFPLGVVFRSADSKYTGGLEQELGALRDTATPNDVWRVILDRNAEVKEQNGKRLLEITELNDEQRGAVKSAFNNTITVITGPPGTGKSQIVLNIIANALLHNESVLFGSKNHKAVDVVVERLSRLQSKPVILKYGRKNVKANLRKNFCQRLNAA